MVPTKLFPSLYWPLLIALLLGVLFYALVHFLASKVFLVDQEGTGLGDRGAREDLVRVGPYLALRGTPTLEAYTLDPSGTAAEICTHVGKLDRKQALLLPQFDQGLELPAVAERKLEVLEYLATLTQRHVIVCASVDPLYYYGTRAQERGPTHKSKDLARWTHALEHFEKVRLDATGETQKTLESKCNAKLVHALRGESGSADRARQIQRIAQECYPSEEMRRIGQRMLLRADWAELEPLQVIERVRDLAESHYWRLWLRCSKDEKVLLHRLAQEGFVNWRMRDTVLRLIRRRLVVADPNYRLMNESFRLFVLGAERKEVFEGWERQAGLGLWLRMRVPLLVGGGALMVVFFATQREALNQTMLLLTALTSSVPLLISMMGFVFRARSAARA